MTAKQLKSLLSASFLTISVLISQLSLAQVGTSVLRQKINQDLPSNNAKAITASKLRSVLNASADAIDDIYESLSLADGLGTYNAATGIATIKETGATFTPTTTASQPSGKYFNVVVAGTQSITGEVKTMEIGGVIISRGTKWDYIPPSQRVDYVEEVQTATATLSSANGATQSGQVITIPVGQTGNATYFGYYMPNATGIYVGQIFTTRFTVAISNYLQLTQPVSSASIAQRIQGGTFQANVAPTSTVATDSISGSTLFRKFTIKQVITTSDVSNGYYYRLIVQLATTNAVSSAVTLTISGNLTKSRPLQSAIDVMRSDIVTLSTTSSSLTSGLAEKQNKAIEEPFTSTVNIANTGGATLAGNVLTIPIGQTGNGTFYGLWTPNATASVVGRKYTARITSVITNQGEITQPISYNLLLQRLQNGSLVTNTTFDSNSYTDNLVGSTLTRTYTLTRTITQADVDNGYYYRFTIQLNNAHAVTAAVTVTISGSLVYDKLLETSLADNTSGLAAMPTTIDSRYDKFFRSIQGTYNGYAVKTVKKNGTGDYTTIQAAIDGISDASIYKQYEVVVYDDFEYTSRSSLQGGAAGSATNSYIFRTKDYVHVRANGSRKKLTVILPNNSVANDLVYTQTVYHAGLSRVENFDIRIKNGRYAIHTEGGGTGDADDRQELINCRVEHLGNKDATNFASWPSDMAWGFGNSSGQVVYAKNCQFIARKQAITYHSNVTYTAPTWLTLERCDLIEREPSASDGSSRTLAMNVTELGSNQRTNVVLIGCNINGHLDLSGSSYLNVTNRDDAFTFWPNISGYGNNAFSIRVLSSPALRFDSFANGSSITVTGGTAKDLIYGTEYISKKGSPDMKGLAVGSINIETGSNGYVTNYMANLGHRLGDCSSVNKTLIVNVDGVDRTVTFDKNYSGGATTSAPAYTNTQILTEINTALSGYATAAIGYSEYYPQFSDTYALCRNSSSTASILRGQGVVFDNSTGSNTVRKAVAGEKIDGIALDNIQHSQSGVLPDMGKVLLKGRALIEKQQFFRPKGYDVVFDPGNNITGVMLKIGSTAGEFVTTSIASEAALIGVDYETWKFVP